MIEKFTFGSITINSYNTMFIVGCVFFVALLCLHRKVYNFPLWKAFVMAVICIPLGYGTTKLLFAFEHNFIFDGFSWYGAVFFMPLVLLILHPFLNRVLKISTHDYIHNLAAPFALMNGFMKVGCTLYGCCFGPVSSCGIYNHIAGAEVFPIQIVEALWNFIVCGIILWFERKPGKIKSVYPMYMIIYSAGRIFCEFGRANNPPIVGFITGGMIYAFVAICIGVLWLYINKKLDEKNYGKRAPKKVGKNDWRR